MKRALVVGRETCEVQVMRRRGARRFVLRVDNDGILRLTVPYGCAIADGMAFAATQTSWIERERARQRQRPRLLPEVQADLQERAKRDLPARCQELAARHGLRVTRVTIRNQRSRWGACGTNGAITLNWRLLLMPPDVAEYVICHELAHLRHANHSSRFWREVSLLFPEWRAAERWLKRQGRDLL